MAEPATNVGVPALLAVVLGYLGIPGTEFVMVLLGSLAGTMLYLQANQSKNVMSGVKAGVFALMMSCIFAWPLAALLVAQGLLMASMPVQFAYSISALVISYTAPIAPELISRLIQKKLGSMGVGETRGAREEGGNDNESSNDK